MPVKADPRRGLVPFTIIVAILSSLLFIYLYLKRAPLPETEGLRKELGEAFGCAGYGLVLIYGRSILKILLGDGPLLQRFIPVEFQEVSSSFLQRLLMVLNRTHKHVGAAVVALLIVHALLMGSARWNIFLELLLIVLVWQGLFGLFLVIRFPAVALRRYGYLVHAQLFSGVMIGLFAIFGHLLT